MLFGSLRSTWAHSDMGASQKTGYGDEASARNISEQRMSVFHPFATPAVEGNFDPLQTPARLRSGNPSILGSCDALSICSGMGRLAQSFDLCSSVNSAIGNDLLDYP